MLKTTGSDVESEAGSVTVTLAVPTVVISAAGTSAVNWVALTNVVTSGVVLKVTTEVGVKFAPVAVIVVSAAPARAPVGAIAFSTTAGAVVPTPLIEKDCGE